MSATAGKPILFAKLLVAALLALSVWWGYSCIQENGDRGLSDVVGVIVMWLVAAGFINGNYSPKEPVNLGEEVEIPATSRILPETKSLPVSRVIGEEARREDILQRAGSSTVTEPKRKKSDEDEDWLCRLHT